MSSRMICVLYRGPTAAAGLHFDPSRELAAQTLPQLQVQTNGEAPRAPTLCSRIRIRTSTFIFKGHLISMATRFSTDDPYMTGTAKPRYDCAADRILSLPTI